MKSAPTIIRNEHKTLSAVVVTLQQLAGGAGHRYPGAQWSALPDLVEYLELFFGQVHGTRDAHLFDVLRGKLASIETTLHSLERGYRGGLEFFGLRQRLAETRAALDQLTAERSQGAELIRGLQRTLPRDRGGGCGDGNAFRAGLEAFAGLHREHVRKEEFIVLPLAENVFSPEDWERVSAACQADMDPRFDDALDSLFLKVVDAFCMARPAARGETMHHAD